MFAYFPQTPETLQRAETFRTTKLFGSLEKGQSDVQDATYDIYIFTLNTLIYLGPVYIELGDSRAQVREVTRLGGVTRLSI